MRKDLIIVHEEVLDALNEGKPVVALESTIISHGMPYPENLNTATQVEVAVRNHGAVPATIAVIRGKIHVGLDAHSMSELAQSKDVMKLSRRDLPFAISEKRNGATTVAATMICSEMVGINVFATGGIGGVHRGADQNFDISADLFELAKTSIAVVSAGAKAILDLPATLEYLETLGVPVLGYKSDFFAAFYTRSSGLPLEMVMQDPQAVARFLHAKWSMHLHGGVLISNPVSEGNAMDQKEMETAIEMALEEAKNLGVKGKEITPFLLRKIKDVTKGRSLETNISLILSNAALAAQIARAYRDISQQERP